ncbi:Fe-S cluster domain protein [Desulfatibacillum aliphaticivorans]|uniref:Fe-S cluster domain protein n=1 Tax=Desulfatibacillum aliphaticivorans TaxID=218208 RepID=B8FLU4_DESAL|nr:DUF3786 domain-containing protein [Desulfatibacillum aliphaticivorans]ACL05448.1 Fe-S cluster domain protein [Desulfatibacillum aliphaticivorans]
MNGKKSTVDIYKLLEKSNCRECGYPTCMAFAAAVFQGRSHLKDCPRLDPAVAEAEGGAPAQTVDPGEEINKALEEFRAQMKDVDLEARAKVLGGRYANGRLILKILGKDFGVDNAGKIHTDIHVNPWVAAPFFAYVLHGQGVEPSGEWISLRELEGGQPLYGLFVQRVEQPIRKVADAYPDLFADMVDLFGGKEVEPAYQSDISVVLQVLPKVPIMVCYWRPEDGMESNFNLFFDANANKNLPTQALYTLSGGLGNMFEKLALRHGVAV